MTQVWLSESRVEKENWLTKLSFDLHTCSMAHTHIHDDAAAAADDDDDNDNEILKSCKIIMSWIQFLELKIK